MSAGMIVKRTRRCDYGIDAPGLVRAFLLAGGVLLAVTLALAAFGPGGTPGVVLTMATALGTVYALGMGGFMLFESRVGKLRTRERLLDRIAWRGDETVLDIGCGRGLMLVGAARRLARGHATGIDIWAARDQSGNGPEGARENASIEGVAERVTVATADMRALPFADASVDVVLSHWAIHNLEDADDRAQALAEVARVLRPDGTALIVDIAHRGEYAARLATLGLTEQTLVVAPVRDLVLGVLTFGSFRPAALFARR